MTKEQAIERLKKLDYLLDDVYSTGLVEDEERNKYQDAIETVLPMLEEKDKIIGKMIDNIMIHYQLKTIRKMCCSTCRIEKTCIYSGIHRNCIKQYFENKAKERR